MKTAGNVIYLNPSKRRNARRATPARVYVLPQRQSLTERIRNDVDPFPTRRAS